MSTMMRLPLIGLYNYDNSLFDNLSLPDGYDKTTFINSLLLEHGEKSVLYADFDFFKFAIGSWSAKWELELTRILEALTAEYNPIHNYDRNEKIKDTYKKGTTLTTTADYNNTRTPNLSYNTERLKNEETERKVSAFNSSSYEPSEKTIVSGGEVKESESGNEKTNIKGTLSETKSNGQDITIHEATVSGNIGVTTAAAMVNEVVAQRMSKNLYSLATRIFADELLINIY